MRIISMLAVSLVGCSGAEAVSSDDVITVSHCPHDVGVCSAVADGQSEITVDVRIPSEVTQRKAGLVAVLQLSSGHWLHPTDPTKPTLLDVPLSVEGYATPSFITSTSLGPVRVDASLAGYTSTDYIELHPAELDEETLSIVPSARIAANSDLVLDVKIRAKNNGTPSSGTKVSYSTEVEPATASVVAFPSQIVLAGDSASAKLAVLGVPTSVAVTVTVTPPDDPTGEAVVAVKKTFSLPLAGD